MNKNLFRLIFSKRLGMYVPAWEGATTRGQKKSSGKRARKLATALALLTAGTALANPTGPSVVNGQAVFSTSGNTLTIANSPNAIINWQGFSIGRDELTRFIQQNASSAVLNRVTGQNPSTILGALQSNGRVFLINPNGIVFGQGSRIDVAGLVASTLKMSDQDFLAGRVRFGEQPGAAAISQRGAITTPDGGQVYLIAPSVENSGVITTPQGEIILAAGKSAELVSAANPSISVEITAPEHQALNVGQLVAQGGNIGMYAGLIGQNGGVHADSAVIGENGNIILKGSQVTLGAGTTSARNSAGTGGTIHVLGDEINLQAGAALDVSGQTGGGTLLVGGDEQGSNASIPNARNTTVAQGATLKANAGMSGDGGKVIVWSDDTTRFHGDIAARGGEQNGNGGFAEVSGKAHLNVTGHADLAAPKGAVGTFLLDPGSVTIVTGSANPSGALDVFTNGYIQAQLANSNLTISTANSSSNNPQENLTVNAPISWSAGTTLRLTARNDLFVNQGITNTGTGSLILDAWNNANIGASLSTVGGTITLRGQQFVGGQGFIYAPVVNATFTGGTSTFGPGSVYNVASTTVSGGTLNLATGSALSFTNPLTISSGVLDATDAITAATLNWSGGTITGSGALNTTGVGTLSGGGGKVLQDKTWNNSGTLNLTAGQLVLADTGAPGSAILNNQAGGVINVTSADGAPINTTAGNPTLNNAGTLNWGDGTGAMRILQVGNFNNSNLVNVNDGLDLRASGTDTGTYDVDAGKTLDFSSGTRTLAAGSNITGLGNVSVSGGIVTANGNFGIANTGSGTVSGGTLNLATGSALSFTNPLTISSGVLDATDAITAATLNWSGGTITGSGALNTTGVGTLSGGGGKVLQDKTWNNSGTLNLTAGQLVLADTGAPGSAILNNQAGGVINVTSADGAPINTTAGNPTLNNAGTLNWGDGTGAMRILQVGNFNNSNLVNVNDGLDLRASGTDTGTYDVDAGKTLDFSSGTRNWNSGTTITGLGALQITGGTVNNSTTINVTSSIGGTGTLNNTASGTITNAAGTHTITPTVTNSGTVNVTGGRLNLPNSTSNNSGGLLNVASGATLGLGSSYTNNGMIKGTGAIDLLNGTGTLTNAGTISPGASPGTLSITGNLVMSSSGILEIELGGTAPGQYDVINVSGSAALAGTMNVLQANGFVANANDTFVVLTYASRTGTFNTINSPAAFTVTPTYGAGAFTLTASQIAAIINRWIASGGGDWNLPSNWSLGVPTATQDVEIDVPGALVVIIVPTGSNFAGSLLSQETLNVLGNLTVSNNTTLNAALNINGGNVTFNGLTALSGINLNSGSLGGTLSTINGGILNLFGGNLNNVSLDMDAVVSGRTQFANTLTLLNGHRVTLGVGNNTGVITGTTGTSTLAGTGEIVFGGNSPSSRIEAGNGQTLVIGSGIRVHSGAGGQSGWIGGGSQTFNLVNQGIISADVAGRSITISNYSGSNASNSGSIEAINGGTLSFGAGTNWSNTGTLRAATNSILNLAGDWNTAGLGTLDTASGTFNFTGGTLTNSGAYAIDGATLGTFRLLGGTLSGGTYTSSSGGVLNLSGGNLNNVSLDMDAVLSGPTQFANTLTLLNGRRVTLGSGNNTGVLTGTTATSTLAGTGEIVFGGNSPSSRIEAGNGQTLVIGSGIRVHSGAGGQSGWIGGGSQTFNLVNQGIISADVAGRSITIWPNLGSNASNSGTIEAINGGTLIFGAGTNWSNTGTLRAATNSILNLAGDWNTAGLGTLDTASGTFNFTGGTLTNSGAYAIDGATLGTFRLLGGTLSGGTYTSSSGGVLNLSGGNLNNVSLDMDAVLSGPTQFANTLTLLNGRRVTLGSGNNTGVLTGTTATSTLAGTGEIVFGGNSPSSRIEAGNGQTLVIGSGIRVHSGAGGQSGWIGGGSQTFNLVNQGIISADVAGRSITISNYSGSNASNSGTIEAINGGTISFGAGFTVAANTGTLFSGAGSTIDFGNRDITNTISGVVAGSGRFNFGAGFGLINQGLIRPGTSPGTLTINGNLTMTAGGTLEIEIGGATPGTQHDVLNVSGTANFAGTLTVRQTNKFVPNANDTFVVLNYANHTGTFNTINSPTAFTVTPTYGAGAFTLTASQIAAIINNWIFNGGGSWTTASNWSLGVPTSNQDVVIDVPNSLVVILVPAGTHFAGTLLSQETLDLMGNLTISNNATLNGALNINGGAATFNGPSTFAGINMTGGTLSGAGTLTIPNLTVTGGTNTISALNVTNAFNWSGGIISGSGALNTAGVSTLSGNTSKDLRDKTWNNTGTLNLTAGQLVFNDTAAAGSAVLNNQAGAVLNVTSADANPFSTGGGVTTLDNAGTLNWGDGTGVMRNLTVGSFNNSGLVNVNDGLELRADGTDAGTYDVDAGKTLRFTSGTRTMSVGSNIIGQGTANFGTATVTVNGNLGIAGTGSVSLTGGFFNLATGSAVNFTSPLTITSGFLDATDAITAATLNWSGGTIGGSGLLSTPGVSTLSGANQILRGKTWNNTGTLNLTAGTLLLNDTGPGAILNNQAGGVLNVTSSSSNPIATGSGGVTSVNNAGTLNWGDGTGVMRNIEIANFNNSGLVNVNDGLDLRASGTDTGVYAVDAGKTLLFMTGSRTLAAGSNITGLGTANFFAGTVTANGSLGIAGTGSVAVTGGVFNLATGSVISFANPLTVSGGVLDATDAITAATLNWSGGLILGSGLLTTSGVSTLSSAGGMQLRDKTWNNTGTVYLTGGVLILGDTSAPGSAIFNNQAGGVFNVTSSDTNPFLSGGGVNTFNNAGTLNWGDGTGAMRIFAFTNFNNSNLVNVNDGLILQSGGNDTGVYAVDAGKTLNFASGFGGPRNWNAGTAITGPGTVQMTSTTVNNNTIINLDRDITGSGTLNNSASGVINNAAGTNTITPTVTNSGTINVTGGRLNLPNSTSNNNGGLLNVASGATLGLNGAYTNNGIIKGTGTIELLGNVGTLLTNAGTISPGASPGTLAIIGNLMMSPSGILEIELGGTAPGQYDVINVSGSAALAGTMNVLQANGFVANANDTFVVLTYASHTGTFNTINSPAAFTVTPTYGAGAFSLTASQIAAIINNWIFNGGGSWTTASNWSLGVPTSNQDVVIDVPNSLVVILVPAGTHFAGTLLSQETLNVLGNLTISNNATLNGALNINGGAATFNGPSTFAGINMTGGTLSGAGTLTIPNLTVTGGTNTISALNVTNAFNWSGGGIAGTGLLNTTGVSILSSSSYKHLHSKTWTNSGTVNIDGRLVLDATLANSTFLNSGTVNLNGEIFLGGFGAGAVFTNQVGGVVNVALSLAPLTGSGQGSVVTNDGTFNWGSSGNQTGAISNVVFDNTGTVNVNEGLDLPSGTDMGVYNVAANAYLRFFNSSRNINSGGSITGAGGVLFGGGGGITNINSGASLSGQLSVSFGDGTTNINGGATYNTASTLIYGPSAIVNFNNVASTGVLSFLDGTLGGTGNLSLTSPGSVWSGGTVTGGGTLTVANGADLSITGGALGSRTLDINGGGIVTNNITLNLSSDIVGTGTLTNSTTGSILSAGPGTRTITPTLNNAGLLSVTGGTLATPNLVTNAGTLDIGVGATLQRLGSFTNDGVLEGDGTLDLGGTGTLSDAGTIRPGGGGSPGALSILGNLTMTPSGFIEIELGGLTPAQQHDVLNVTGVAALAGALQVLSSGGFVGSPGDTFTVVNCTTCSGNFASIIQPSGFNVTETVAPTSANLIVAGIPPVQPPAPPVQPPAPPVQPPAPPVQPPAPPVQPPAPPVQPPAPPVQPPVQPPAVNQPTPVLVALSSVVTATQGATASATEPDKEKKNGPAADSDQAARLLSDGSLLEGITDATRLSCN